ncbi:SGNH/GDSL hydrolase family protein [Aeromicrobium ginsengisoli]|uniref:SGNH/GDSL hydrolase family protein n=1 Tax=Aeromicrobium ginsengisoli TaxID=363867 RepID=UPI00165FAA89|nr:SGNH/GDSL hydrolase family protein [Aeromicrobium ginsengisoli]
MTTRRSVILAILAALLIAPFIAWQGATGDERVAASPLAPRGIVVVGDSITARYNDTPGDADQGWWSVVGYHFHAKVTRYAQSGSGYLRPGHACTGDTFIDRPKAYSGAAPSLLVIEGGRNDWAACQDGRFVTASDAAIDHAVDRYLDTLQTFLPASTRIIVLGPPWGPRDQQNRQRVTAIIAAQAKLHGIQFISTTGALTADRVVDGVHPNRKGSLAIARRVIAALDPAS